MQKFHISSAAECHAQAEEGAARKRRRRSGEKTHHRSDMGIRAVVMASSVQSKTNQDTDGKTAETI